MQPAPVNWLERAASLLVAAQLFISSQSDFVTILAMSFVAGLGRYIVSINRRDADKIPTRVHQRVAALTAFMAGVLGFLLVGAQIGNPFVRVGLAGFISLLDQAAARALLGQAVRAALPILNTFSSNPGSDQSGGESNGPQPVTNSEPSSISSPDANPIQ